MMLKKKDFHHQKMFINFKSMNENLLDNQEYTSKNSKLKNFYEKNKTLIYSFLILLFLIFVSINYYLAKQEQKKIYTAESFVNAKIYLNDGDKNEALNLLKEIIYENDSTYSSLSLFLILNENLIYDKNELSNLFTHVIENNLFENEVKNLIIFKKALFESNHIDEIELLRVLNPLLNAETVWKPHALLLIGDYFFHHKQYVKAKEFYNQVLSLKKINNDLYRKANLQLMFIPNE